MSTDARGRLAGKAALVTGAGSGIGAATVEAFIREGATVLAVDVTGAEADVASAHGDRCRSFRADVSRDDEVRAAVAAVVEAFGGLDIICNNAGIEGPMALTGDYDLDAYERVMAVNARGVFLGMRHALPELVRRGGGAIVNTASIASLVAFPQMVAYCATKGAVLEMTKTTAVEYAAQNIRVNCVCPGAIHTAILQALPQEYVAAVEAAAPMKRAGSAAEVANAIVFLASDEASFITGTSLVVDGGYTAV